MSLINAKNFDCFADLVAVYQCDVDYHILTQRKESPIAIISPHGGKIEPGTSEIAKTIAGDNFNLYVFEGIMTSSNYKCLHLTSTKFDDLQCLELISNCKYVISIHGCKNKDEIIYLGGLDHLLKSKIHQALEKNSFLVETNHPQLSALSKHNICNRGLSGAGVQIEVSMGLRRSDKIHLIVNLIRKTLLSLSKKSIEIS